MTNSDKAVFLIERRSWTNLRDHVHEWQNNVARLEGSSAHSFNFRKFSMANGLEKVRLYALGPASSASKDHTLLYLDLPLSSTHDTITTSTATWSSLLEDQCLSTSRSLTKQEQLLLERQRCVVSGITSYRLDEASGVLLFLSGGLIFQAKDDGSDRIVPFALTHSIHAEAPTATAGGTPMDPKLCPGNPELTAFLLNEDIWINYAGNSTRATFAKNWKDRVLSAGCSSYVIQEEFDRYEGFWWQPNRLPQPYNTTSVGTADALNSTHCMDSRKDSNDDQLPVLCYHLLYEETDETDVGEVTITVPASSSEPTEHMRYPKAGQANAKSEIYVLR